MKEAAKGIAIHHKKGYKLFCFDAASIINSPTPKYGILPGARGTQSRSATPKRASMSWEP